MNYTIDQLKSGGAQLYGKLYEAYREAFVRYAKTFRVSEAHALEIFQDTLIVFYENIVNHKVTEFTSSIKTYIFSIGKYKLYEHLRAQKKMFVSETYIHHLADDEPLHYEETHLSDNEKLLKKAFVKLGKKCQRILELFYTESKSIKAIVISENYENENTVKAQKSRCLKTLKNYVNDML